MDGKRTVKKLIPKSLYPLARTVWQKIKRHPDRPMIQEIEQYYQSAPGSSEIMELVTSLPKYGIIPFPYEWAAANTQETAVFHDPEINLPYVCLDTKRLYFPGEWDDEQIKDYFQFTQYVEQHTQSPHRYLTEDFSVNADDIVVDCGVAEGNFSLDIVDKVKRLYLFEPEEIWQKPLHATFGPWSDKVIIVQKYVSDKEDAVSVTLDTYFKDKECPTFCKMDIEGYEVKGLSGAKQLLSSGSLKKIEVCAYHYHDDEEKITNLVSSYGYTVRPANGYMLFNLYDSLRPPYFRRGVLRCEKTHLNCPGNE